MSKKFITLVIAGLLAISLTACSGQQPVPNNENKPTPAAPADANDTNQTVVYAIKLEDDGKAVNSVKVGCGDSAVPVDATVGYQYDKTDPVASINAAMIALTGMTPDQFKAQKLENPVGSQQLLIQSVEKSGNDYIVRLKGAFTFGGVCEMPRVKAQIEETIKKAALGNSFTIDWNGGGKEAWDKAFSQQ